MCGAGTQEPLASQKCNGNRNMRSSVLRQKPAMCLRWFLRSGRWEKQSLSKARVCVGIGSAWLWDWYGWKKKKKSLSIMAKFTVWMDQLCYAVQLCDACSNNMQGITWMGGKGKRMSHSSIPVSLHISCDLLLWCQLMYVWSLDTPFWDRMFKLPVRAR